jgi:hypothetical protein
MDFGVTAITTGYYYTCAVLASSGGVQCWGNNGDGELGDGTTTQRLVPISVVGLSSGVTVIAAGFVHTCVLLAPSGGVQCWGSNWAGQLGDGTTTDRLVPTSVLGLSSGVVAIAAGSACTCALLASGGVQCWGENHYGQLEMARRRSGLRPQMSWASRPVLPPLKRAHSTPARCCRQAACSAGDGTAMASLEMARLIGLCPPMSLDYPPASPPSQRSWPIHARC